MDPFAASQPASEPPSARAAPLSFEDFWFDPSTGELMRSGSPLSLGPVQARVLACLTRRAGDLVTRETLWAEVWPDERIDLDQRLNYAIFQLRRALGDDASRPRLIQTVPRHGYRFLATVQTDTRSWVELSGPAFARPSTHRLAAGGVAASVFAGLVAALAWLAPSGETQRAGRGAEAIELGRYVMSQTDPDLDAAERYFQRAIEEDADLGDAYVGLARVAQERDDWSVAESLFHAALKHDPSSVDAHLTLGARYLFTDWDFARAEAHLGSAVRTDPGRPEAHRLLAHLAVVHGKPELAAKHADRAREADAGHAFSQGDAGWLYYWAGDLQRAVEVCEESVELVGANPLNQACLFSAHLVGGDLAAAVRFIEHDSDEAKALAVRSPEVALAAYYKDRLAINASAPEGAYARARVAAAAGEFDAALAHLREAAEHRHVGLLYASAEPLFDGLRDHPEFERLVAWVRGAKGAPARSGRRSHSAGSSSVSD